MNLLRAQAKAQTYSRTAEVGSAGGSGLAGLGGMLSISFRTILLVGDRHRRAPTGRHIDLIPTPIP